MLCGEICHGLYSSRQTRYRDEYSYFFLFRENVVVGTLFECLLRKNTEKISKCRLLWLRLALNWLMKSLLFDIYLWLYN